MTRRSQEAVARATEALLDRRRRDRREGHLRRRRHRRAPASGSRTRSFELLALQQPVASDLRMLVAALRMVADLERMGDLSVHVAKVARLRVPAGRRARARSCPTIERMADGRREDGRHGRRHHRRARRRRRADELEEDDEEMDQLRRSSFRVMLGDDWPHGVEPAVDIALLGRYYERIADHAVSLARRVVYLVTGESTPTDL